MMKLAISLLIVLVTPVFTSNAALSTASALSGSASASSIPVVQPPAASSSSDEKKESKKEAKESTKEKKEADSEASQQVLLQKMIAQELARMRSALHGDLTALDHYLLPSPWEKQLDLFFEKSDDSQEVLDVNKIMLDACDKKKAKKIGGGCRASVFELLAQDNKQSDNKFVVKMKKRDSEIPYKELNIRENISRVFMAALVRCVIEANHMHKIRVPQKYLYHIRGKPRELTDENYLVVAEKIDVKSLDDYKNVSKEQVFNLARIMATTGLIDMATGNIAIDNDGNLALIDTDSYTLLMRQGDLLSLDELRSFGLHYAQKFSEIFKKLAADSGGVSRSLEHLIVGKNFLNIQGVIDRSDVDCSSMKKIINFYEDIGALGAAITDVSRMYPSLTTSEKGEIVSSICTEWCKRICIDYNLGKETEHSLTNLIPFLT